MPTLVENTTQRATELVTHADFGFLSNLIPLTLVIGISWALSKKVSDGFYIQLPITLAIKYMFPFYNNAFVVISFAIFIMALIGSKADLLSDVKDAPKKIKQWQPTVALRAKAEAFKEDQKRVFQNLKEGYRQIK